LIPLVKLASTPIIYDAIYATGFTLGGLGLVAYNSASEEFLMWGGFISMLFSSVIGMSFKEILYRTKPINSINVYYALFAICLLVLLDVQKLIKNAKTKETWDPINESLSIY